jgi:uncharacterized integral membrane protein
MNYRTYWKRLVRRISIWILLIAFFVQIVAAVFINVEFGEFEMEEFHPLSGLIFFAAILIHLLVIRKSLMSLLTFKTQ